MSKPFLKYFRIKSCFEREIPNSDSTEVLIIANEIKWKNLLNSYDRFFHLTPEDFVNKFQNQIKNDEYNKWLTWVNFSAETEYHFKNITHCENLPDNLK